jgi:hypothetical protein
MVKPLPINNQIRGARRYAAPNSIYFRTWFAQQQRKDRKEVNSRLLLDNYPGAAAAYSLRSLTNTRLTQPVVRVRRSSDNTEQDFTATEITDGTLAGFCGTGDGLVTTWYDQSGNGNDATQNVASSQPRIVDAGVLVTENEKAALDFGNNQFLLASGALSSFAYSDPEFSVIKLLSYNNVSVSMNDILLKSNSQSSVPARVKSSGKYQNLIRFDNDEINQRYGNVQAGIQLSSSFYGSSAYTYINGQNVLSGGLMPSGAASFTDLTISDDEFDQEFYGTYQELIVYPTDQSANREAIEANINAHYGIF